MDEIIIQALIFILTFTFSSAAFLLRKTRQRIEKKTQRNTASMFKVRDIVHGKIRKFKH